MSCQRLQVKGLARLPPGLRTSQKTIGRQGAARAEFIALRVAANATKKHPWCADNRSALDLLSNRATPADRCSCRSRGQGVDGAAAATACRTWFAEWLTSLGGLSPSPKIRQNLGRSRTDGARIEWECSIPNGGYLAMGHRDQGHAQRITELVDAARRQHKTTPAHWGQNEYLRLSDGYRRLARGTAVFGSSIVAGYPGIGRILALRQGLQEHFRERFWVEEKVNGYNVRIFRLQQQLVALTRGGFYCPFTTDRIPDLLDVSLFERHPDLIVCAEVAGPGQPYLESAPSFVAEDVQLFVFDLMRFNRLGFLPQGECYDIVERFALSAVRRYGAFTTDDSQQIQQILLQLNDEQREGLVFKEDSERNRRAKYVTSNSSIADIRVTAAGIVDLPPEFFTNRILRLVLFLQEQGLRHSAELSQRLGDAFLDGLAEAIEQYSEQKKVAHRYHCRFREQHNALAMIQHMDSVGSRQVQLTWQDLRFEDGYWVLEFDKLYSGMTGLLANLLSGGMVYD